MLSKIINDRLCTIRKLSRGNIDQSGYVLSMEELVMLVLLLNLIYPFVMVFIGIILKKHKVSDMQRHNGYNTPTSRKSQAHWDYAQKIAPNIYITLGKYLFLLEIIVSMALFFLRVSDEISLMIGGGIGFTCLFSAFYYTDTKIEENFEAK